VVLVEFWGVNCPPCLASIPKLAAWNQEMQAQGLTVIGAHAQNEPVEKIRATAKSRGANYTIVGNATLKTGHDFRGIPHCILFDHTGKCLFRGGPNEVESLLRKAIQDAPPVILEGKNLTRLTALNRTLKREQTFGAALKQARTEAKSDDSARAEEGTYVIDKLTAFGRKLIDGAKEKKELEPLETMTLTQRAATIFAGSDLGTEASALLTSLKKDTKFQADLKVWQTLQNVRSLQAGLIWPPGPQDPQSRAFQATNARTLQQMTTLIKGMQKAAPESKATDAAKEIATQLGLKLG
jgi:thiol-disulfide isomerase/thioredoxin